MIFVFVFTSNIFKLLFLWLADLHLFKATNSKELQSFLSNIQRCSWTLQRVFLKKWITQQKAYQCILWTALLCPDRKFSVGQLIKCLVLVKESCQSWVHVILFRWRTQAEGLLQSIMCWIVTVTSAECSLLWKQIPGPNHSLSHEGI